MTSSAWSYEDAARSASPFGMPTSPRNVSGPLAFDSLSNVSENSLSPAQWRTNPHSAPQTNNKTSQYIDKITAENERLRRELKAERLAREEEAKRVGAAKEKEQESRAEYQHLQVLAEANARAIERKDRKLEELKAQLEVETKRRIAAEESAATSLRLLGDERADTQRQVAVAMEKQHHAEASLEAQRDGIKRIHESYERKIRSMNDELHELRMARRAHADQVRRQAVVHDQLHAEVNHVLRTENKMGEMLQTFKEEQRKELDSLVSEARQLRSAIPEKMAQASALVNDMEQTRDKMKWVMANRRATSADKVTTLDNPTPKSPAPNTAKDPTTPTPKKHRSHRFF
ncbi:hypothetical protein GQ43DRAFT_444727 [Delitschia confertaspora ATCC 74209]|uniref:SWI5-dependent HO expression protein 3 n=1 Tax=Delitschia confertaspora ATCC 74209 TaxID=1513339 RepID=A0A9P4MN94_9PLEO|nr:hypothetical protein GQ43DRAFT_444727 [Delitschia confertaspora ATCC 74209]